MAEYTRLAIAITVIAERAPAAADCGLQDATDRRRKTRQVLRWNRISRLAGVEPGAEERFIGVDISDARKNALVEEYRLDRSL